MNKIPNQRGRDQTPNSAAEPPEPERTQWVVLAIDSQQRAALIGNAYGKALGKQEQADRLRNRLDDKYPAWHFLTLPITSRKEWGQ